MNEQDRDLLCCSGLTVLNWLQKQFYLLWNCTPKVPPPRSVQRAACMRAP
jgi:hypothetical protein